MEQFTLETRITEKENRKRNRNVLKGTIVVIIGAILLASQLGVEFPVWFLTWQMLLIAIGIYNGVNKGFRNSGWIIAVSIGLLFLAKDYMEGFSGYYVWPVVIIIIGLSMILNSRRKHTHY